jgi:glyoxylase-like metal-dependent hydrolase (beta-lactamase superfamily II)
MTLQRPLLQHSVFRNTLRAFAFIFALASATVAQAAAPLVKTIAPGFYHTMVGNIEVTALSDGTISPPMDKLMTNITQETVDKQMARHFLKSPADTSVNGFLVNTGSKLILVDTGAGINFGPTVGKLLDNLKAAGYQPEQVDEIYITHMHGDHIGGLIANGKAAFPNAIVRASKRDADYWLSPTNMEKAANDQKGSFKTAATDLDPYVKAGRFKTFDGNTELTPGVSAVAAPGHTPGHTAYMVESKGQKLMLWGDLVHLAAVQFEHPEASVQFDTDTKTAAAERKKAFADAARQGYMIGGAHLAYPGLGHIRAEGSGYVYEPVNYAPLH